MVHPYMVHPGVALVGVGADFGACAMGAVSGLVLVVFRPSVRSRASLFFFDLAARLIFFFTTMPRILSIDEPVSFLCPTLSVFVSLSYLHFSMIFFIYLSLCIIFASIRSISPPAAGFIIDGDLLFFLHFLSGSRPPWRTSSLSSSSLRLST
jgi:hypothetical protein